MRIRPQRGWEVGVSTIPTVGKSLRVSTFVTDHSGSGFLPYRQWVILAVGKSLRVCYRLIMVFSAVPWVFYVWLLNVGLLPTGELVARGFGAGLMFRVSTVGVTYIRSLFLHYRG